MDGRYPPSGNVVNLVVKEMVYVQEGSGKLGINQQEYSLQAGDLVLIEPNEKYHWEGKMVLHISCQPAWTAEQHSLVD